MELIRVSNTQPGLLAYLGHGGQVQPDKPRSLLLVDQALGTDGQGATLLGGGIIEKGVGTCTDDLFGQRRGGSQIPGDHLDPAGLDVPQQAFQARDIHDLGETVLQSLVDQGVVRDLAFALEVFQARELIRKDKRHQILSRGALELRQYLVAAPVASYRQRSSSVPAPVGAEQGDIEQGLGQQPAHPGAGKELLTSSSAKLCTAPRERMMQSSNAAAWSSKLKVKRSRTIRSWVGSRPRAAWAAP